MKEQIKIIIEPPISHPEFFTIKDAMEQILDYFQLVSIGDLDAQSIIWKLVSVRMESPLMVTGEAESFDPNISIDEIAKKQKDRLGNGLKSMLQGVIPDEWKFGEASQIVDRVLKRNTNGIGKTDIILDFQEDIPPIEITPRLADLAIKEISQQPSSLFEEDLSHKELGSVDGYLIAVGSYYGNPSLQIKDRLTNEDIQCEVPEEFIKEISELMNLKDVWDHKRIIVNGLIYYDKSGKIKKVHEAQVEKIISKEISIDKISDTTFTQGMTPREYLDKFREGDLD